MRQKWSPLPFDAKPSDVRQVLEEISSKCESYSREAFWTKIMETGRLGRTVGQARKELNEYKEKGDKAIAYMSQLAEIRAALSQIDQMARSGGRQVDPKAAGEAFGVMFEAAASMWSYAPPPFTIYADIMGYWGKEFLGKVAEMLVGHNPTKRSMDVTQRQAQWGRDNGWDHPDSKQFAR